MTQNVPSDPLKSEARPRRPKIAKVLLAEIGGGVLPPSDPNGPAGPSEPAEVGRPDGQGSADASARTAAKGPTGPAESPDDIGLASANGPTEA